MSRAYRNPKCPDCGSLRTYTNDNTLQRPLFRCVGCSREFRPGDGKADPVEALMLAAFKVDHVYDGADPGNLRAVVDDLRNKAAAVRELRRESARKQGPDKVEISREQAVALALLWDAIAEEDSRGLAPDTTAALWAVCAVFEGGSLVSPTNGEEERALKAGEDYRRAGDEDGDT